MKTIKIKLHSSVELITNSSTVIFTYSEGALKTVKELVNEMLKVFGNEDKTFDDLFYADVFLTNSYYYYDEDYNTELPEEMQGLVEREEKKAFVDDIKVKILKKEIEKPQWMIAIEEADLECDDYHASTSLELLPKDEKYSELANKLLKYLTSTDHEATRDG